MVLSAEYQSVYGKLSENKEHNSCSLQMAEISRRTRDHAALSPFTSVTAYKAAQRLHEAWRFKQPAAIEGLSLASLSWCMSSAPREDQSTRKPAKNTQLDLKNWDGVSGRGKRILI